MEEQRVKHTHTPGPWEGDAEYPDRLFVPDYGRIWINGYDSEGAPIHIGYVDGPRTVERMANARVIAAAPELLEACESLLRFAERDRLPTDVAVNAARTAIAKAKGEQP